MSSQKTKKPNILILGGSSYIGKYLFARLGVSKAIATYYKNPIDNAVYFDSTSMELSEVLKYDHNISYAVILLGDTHPDSCASCPVKSYSLNVASIKSILGYLKIQHIKPLFISTEFVFDGQKGNYIESDSANPILVYGQQKLEVEQYIMDNFNDFIILRLGKVFGSDLGDGTLFSGWLKIIGRDKSIPCATDQIFSPIYVEDVIDGIISAIDNNLNGIFHLAGRKPFVRVELLKMLLMYVKEYRNINVEVIPKSINDFNLLEKRPLNVSMNPGNIVNATGLKISNVEDICKKIVEKKFVYQQ